jgi:hypothetical protein
MVDAFKKIAKEEGFSAFYKGIFFRLFFRDCYAVDWDWVSGFCDVFYVLVCEESFE